MLAWLRKAMQAHCILQPYRPPQASLLVQEVLQGFRRGKLQALVALEAFVGRARLPRNVQHVVHYDAPSSPDSYIRSVARTGPVASDGHALTFLSRSHAALAQPLLELLQVGCMWTCSTVL